MSLSPSPATLKPRTFLLLATALTLLLVLANLAWGSVKIPLDAVIDICLGKGAEKPGWDFIVLQSRLPQAITALLAGASLATAGLMLQTAFNNPLAGPSILGVNSGAGLGVAIVMLLLGGSIGSSSFMLSGTLAVLTGAMTGAIVVLGVIIAFASMVKSNVMLLIIGIMVGYITSSAISLLNFFATAEGVFSYTIWGLGDFSGISMAQMPFFAIATLIGLVGALLLIKPLDALLLGERYAANLGVNVRLTRIGLLLCTGWLTAVVTAYCGPIAFIGLAVPHIARLLLQSSNHRWIVPATMLTGSVVALLCNLLCVLPGELGIIPLNAVTPLFGAPVIIYVIVNQRKIQYFN